MESKKRIFIQTVNENRGIIRSLCNVYYCREEDQKDAFQDIIYQLWKSFDSFRGDAQVTTWIYRVSLNTLLSKIRSDRKSITTEPIETLQHMVSGVGADDNVELLSIAIHSLKEIDKAIVLLYLEGYQNKEIAEMLNLSATNVATRFNRLKSALKIKFNQQTHATR